MIDGENVDLPMYLNCHSWFSFKYGVMKPLTLLNEATKQGLRSIALTDIHCTAGVSDFLRYAPDHGIRPVVGIEFRQGHNLLYIGLARNNTGFQELNDLLSRHLLNGEPLPERAPELNDAFIVYPFGSAPKHLRSYERVGVKPADLTRLPFTPWARRHTELVALLPVTFTNAQDFNTHRLLRTVAKNTLLSMLPVEETASPDERFRPAEEVRHIYEGYPFLVRNAELLLEQCEVSFDRTDKTRKAFGANMAADREKLHREALEGVHYRYPNASSRVMERILHELTVIEEMGFMSYFLINKDIIDHARSRGFFHVGRGSGANSLVAYCLRITDVDPLELDLYFERFINPARKKPPDFDIDFSWKDRDEIFRYVFEKYNGTSGPGGRVSGIHAAHIATYTTFQWRGAIRELGKAMGLPPAEVDALSAGDSNHYRDQRRVPDGAKGDLDNVARAVIKYGHRLIGMPHHLGIHAGGIVITEEPVTCFTALYRPPKGFPVTQFSMLEAEDLGLHKFDLLSQRGLGHIRDAVELVNETPVPNHRSQDQPTEATAPDAGALCSGSSGFRGSGVDIHDIQRFKQDPAIKELLRSGNTIGCFYVESPAMRMLLRKLQVDDYLGLVAASSIIRPGVAESGMMREYLLRHHDADRRLLGPKGLLDLLPETYGVMVYQEDVIRVVTEYGGLDASEADQVRRGMNIRYRDRPEFKLVEKKFFDNCRSFGYPSGEPEEVWRQIESFASFSFAKGHSASYAVESYQSLYLKAHHPLEFLVSVANNFGGFYNTEFYLHEAKRAGAEIEAPCVNTSDELCRKVEGGEHRSTSNSHIDPAKPRIYLGLGNIKGLQAETVRSILDERRARGPYTDLQDLLERVSIEAEQLRTLIRVGALRSTGKSKPRLLWEATLLHRPATISTDQDLFVTTVAEPRLPALEHHPLSDPYDEIELLGFPLCDPFSLVEPEEAEPESSPTPRILKRDMDNHVGQRVRMLGYLIHVKTTDTHYGQRMTFGSFIDPAGDFWDSTQFPEIAARYSFNGRGVYRFTGVVESEFGHAALRTERFEKLPWKPDPRYGTK